MHVLFVHQNFPAQFGHIAGHLVQHYGHRCTFVSERPEMMAGGVECLQYKVHGGARETTHYCSRTFENQIWHSAAVLDALRQRPDIQPDLIVGHSGFLSTIFLRELYDAPQINYFEYFYRTKNSDQDFRTDLPPADMPARIRGRIRNASLLLDLENCNSGYSPTRWQRDQLPTEFHGKVAAIFDGIETSLWRPMDTPTRNIAGWKIPDDKKVITYVSRGMESMRGFDIFMKVAKQICDKRNDVLFLIAGEDRVAYGGDGRFTGGKTFKRWVLDQDSFDLNRILFLGRIAPTELAKLFALSDLHLYLTVPFVLSWSLFNALACETVVLASDTGPVREIIQPGKVGLLTDFFDIDAWVRTACQILDDLPAYQHLGSGGRELILKHYSMEACIPQIVELYEATARMP